jgi:hypothetical protein
MLAARMPDMVETHAITIRDGRIVEQPEPPIIEASAS